LGNPLISVILPVYNAERFISQAITSIIQQSFGDFELILINDGSTDRSKYIIQSFIDPRIIFIENSKNCGLIFSLNKGIELASGKYIARMDADDISHPDRFQKQVIFLEGHPACAAIGSAYLPVDENNHPVMLPVQRPLWPSCAEWFMVIGSPLAHPSVMYRTNLARQIGGYDSKYAHAEDYEFWSRLIKVGSICSLPEVLLRYRTGNSERISEKYFSEQFEITIEIRRKYFLEQFGKEMPLRISQVIQNSGGKSNDTDKKETCLQLLYAYQQIVHKYDLKNEEMKDLDDMVFCYLKAISGQIVDMSYLIRVTKHPVNIRAFNKLERFSTFIFQNLINRGKTIFKKIIRAIKPRKDIHF